MNGGAWEYVMGNQVSTAGGLYSPNAGITISEARYYDTYVYNTNEAAHERGHLGDATRETLSAFGNINAGTWYGNGTAWFPGGAASWFVRGGGAIQTSVSSLFSFSRVAGNARTDVSFRSVLTRTA